MAEGWGSSCPRLLKNFWPKTLEIDNIRRKARGSGVRIIFPESGDKRVLKASKVISEKSLARPLIFNSDPVSLEEGARMVAKGEADAMVAGACHPTSEVIKAAIRNVGLREREGLVSSFFLMEGRGSWGENGSFLFADCAVVPDPDGPKLARIALDTARAAKRLLGWEPRVAFVSFSTKGSSSHPGAVKAAEAVRVLQKKGPDFKFDGEIQFDAAVDPSVAEKKDPEGKLKGKANIIIFPDLNSANIGYKIAQRLGGMEAAGPIMQGLKKPVNDLSRGCSVKDIVDVASFTALQAIS